MNAIHFYRLDTEAQIQQHDLDRFAASFGHEVVRLFPIWIAYVNGRLACYCYLHNQMIAYPSISPLLSPREFYQLAWTWFSKIKLEYGDPIVAVSQTGKEHLFSKIGLLPFNKELYRIAD